MEPIKDLNELRAYLSKNVGKSVLAIRNGYWKNFKQPLSHLLITPPHWEAMRTVIVANRDTGIRACEKYQKEDGDIEIMRLQKSEVKEGIKPERWDKITVKCSQWLEDNGFYPKQSRITAETPEFIQQ
ncbi:MAG: hypothetical protein WC389_08045 [Lutibacter sp.]